MYFVQFNQHYIQTHAQQNLAYLLSFANDGPDCPEGKRFRERGHTSWLQFNSLLTMNVATFATSAPHVSAIISNVSERVAISIPLLTKMSNGNAFMSNRDRSSFRFSL